MKKRYVVKFRGDIPYINDTKHLELYGYDDRSILCWFNDQRHLELDIEKANYLCDILNDHQRLKHRDQKLKDFAKENNLVTNSPIFEKLMQSLEQD